MSGSLIHDQAQIVAQLIQNLGLGSDPLARPLEAWPVYSYQEPSSPDSVITVYTTTGRREGRTQPDGESQQHHGFQVRVRDARPDLGSTKANAIATAFDRDVYQEGVTISSSQYLVHSISNTTDVLSLGIESPTSSRFIFTLNAIVAVRQTV